MKNFLYDSLFVLAMLSMVTLVALVILGIASLLSIISPVLGVVAIGLGISFGATGIAVILDKLFTKY